MTTSHDTPDTGDALALDAQLCFALYSTQLAMNRLYRDLLRELELTYPQYLVMLVLWQTDRRSVSAIGAELYLDSATLTPLLKRLEAAGLLTRRRASDDERRVDVALTEQGRALRQRAEAIPEAAGGASRCSREETLALKQGLERLRQQLLES